MKLKRLKEIIEYLLHIDEQATCSITADCLLEVFIDDGGHYEEYLKKYDIHCASSYSDGHYILEI